MGIKIYLGLLLIFAAYLPVSCAVLPPLTGSPDEETAYFDLDEVTFTVESVRGNVQIKNNRNTDWHTLKEGESFNGYAFVRSGIRSGATLSVNNGQKNFKCEICDLVSEITINDLYNKLFSPEGVKSYHERHWGELKRINPNAPIVVNRDSISEFKMDPSESLLADACSNINSRKTTAVDGSSSGMAAGGSGAAAASGGCGPGG